MGSRQPGESCGPGEWAELGAEFTCSRPGSERGPGEKPRGLWGAVHINCSRLGGWARGPCCATLRGGEVLNLVFGCLWKAVAVKSEQRHSFPPHWLPHPLPLVPRLAGLGVSFTVEPRTCLQFLLFICSLFLFLSLPTSPLLEVEEKRPGEQQGAGREREYFWKSSPSLLIPPSAFSCGLIIPTRPHCGEKSWVSYL